MTVIRRAPHVVVLMLLATLFAACNHNQTATPVNTQEPADEPIATEAPIEAPEDE